MSTAGGIVLMCFHARTAAHILHLKTRSYAAHKALNDFYDGIVPRVDAFAEAYQGDYGIIEYPAMRYRPYDDALEMLNDLSTYIEESRASACDEDDTYLQNLIDEIVALIRQTQYKLRFLK